MTYRIQGTLKLPDGAPAANCEIEFVSRKNFSPLVQGAKTNILTSATGAYDVTLELGEYAVIVYTGGTYPAQAGTITLSADTTPGLDLPSLLNRSDWVPATPEYMQQIEAWLVSANASAASAANSANSAASTLANALTKSGNLSGLSSPDAALGNLGLTTVGKAVAKALDDAAARAAIGAFASSGGAISGAIKFAKDSGAYLYDNLSSDILGRSSDKGIYIHNGGGYALFSGTATVHPCVLRGSNTYPLYHQGNKPTAADVGAYSKTEVPYETGAFTPTVSGSTTAGSCTYSTREGRYTRIGNICFYKIKLTWSGHTGAGQIWITGIPFTAADSANMSASVRAAYLDVGDGVVANLFSSTIAINKNVSGATSGVVPFVAAGEVLMTGFYYI